MSLVSLLARQRWLTGLLILAAMARLVPIWPSHFPFMYDHAKDSLVMMEMVASFKPALSGAVTSIDGVFNGPAFYYLALPFNLLTGFHPVGSVLAVLILSLISIYIIFRFVGWFEALLYATSIGVVGTQQSAWAPYLTTLIMVPILVILWQYRSWKKFPLAPLLLLFLFIGLLFHAQTAFGVVMLGLTVFILVAGAFRIKWWAWGLAGLVFAATFSPFMVFELRNDFHQTRQIIKFVTDYQYESTKVEGFADELDKPLRIAQVVTSSATQSLVPIDLGPVLNLLAGLMMILLAVKYYMENFWKEIRRPELVEKTWQWLILPWRLVKIGDGDQRRSWRELLYMVVLIGGPSLAYLFLPFKAYYLVALYPVWIIILGNFLGGKFDSKHLGLFSSAIIIFALGQIMIGRQDYQSHAQFSAVTLDPKLAAVEKIYQLAGDDDFYVYTFVPEIYDYTYQHLLLRERFFGRQLPLEFSYAPGESGYMAHIRKPAVPDESEQFDQMPDRVFLIVESAGDTELFKLWWGRVVGDREVVDEHQINEAVVVYELADE